MDASNKIVKNIFSLFTGNIVSTILTIVLSIYIARYLGSVIFGRYSFVIAFITIFTIFLDLGYDTLLVRDVAKNKLKASIYLNNIISIRAILSIIIFIAIFLFINIFNFSENIKNIIYIFGFSYILSAISNIFKVTFRAFERMDYEAIINILANIIRCSLGILILYLGYGLIEIALVFLYSSIFELFISYIVCEKKFVKTKSQLDLTFLKESIKIALPIGFLAIFGLIYVKIDTVMLTAMKGDAVVGWYNAAYNLILGFRSIPQLIMNALLPYMSYTYLKSKDSFRDVYEKSFKFLIVIGLPITLGIFLLADKFILLFYGPEYLNSVNALRVLSWDLLLTFLYLCIWYVLISVNKQNQLTIIAGIGALINIVLNLILIPNYSLVGSAIATIITETFILLVYFYITYINNLKIPIKKIITKPLLACSIMIIFIYYFNEINLYLLISLSIIIYFGIFLAIKGFSKEEISLLKNIVIKKK